MGARRLERDDVFGTQASLPPANPGRFTEPQQQQGTRADLHTVRWVTPISGEHLV